MTEPSTLYAEILRRLEAALPLAEIEPLAGQLESLEPDSERSVLVRSELLGRQGRRADAVALLRARISRNGSAHLRLQLAKLVATDGGFASALDEARLAMASAPNLKQGASFLAALANRVRGTSGVAQELSAIARHPLSYRAQVILGKLAFESADQQGAAQWWQEAFERSEGAAEVAAAIRQVAGPLAERLVPALQISPLKQKVNIVSVRGPLWLNRLEAALALPPPAAFPEVVVWPFSSDDVNDHRYPASLVFGLPMYLAESVRLKCGLRTTAMVQVHQTQGLARFRAPWHLKAPKATPSTGPRSVWIRGHLSKEGIDQDRLTLEVIEAAEMKTMVRQQITAAHGMERFVHQVEEAVLATLAHACQATTTPIPLLTLSHSPREDYLGALPHALLEILQVEGAFVPSRPESDTSWVEACAALSDGYPSWVAPKLLVLSAFGAARRSGSSAVHALERQLRFWVEPAPAVKDPWGDVLPLARRWLGDVGA
jgi:hypothetical protein